MPCECVRSSVSVPRCLSVLAFTRRFRCEFKWPSALRTDGFATKYPLACLCLRVHARKSWEKSRESQMISIASLLPWPLTAKSDFVGAQPHAIFATLRNAGTSVHSASGAEPRTAAGAQHCHSTDEHPQRFHKKVAYCTI